MIPSGAANLDVDVVVLGAGFGGSLTALLLNRIGLRTAVLDRNRHPRFAIGESSTPIGNMVLRDISKKYGLPRLLPLVKYGSWRDSYPQLIRGPKRGFSYFKHQADQPFEARADHANELLVAASRELTQADTHWLRSDVDQFLARELIEAEIPYLDRTDVSLRREADAWRLAGQREGRAINVRARMLVDATGAAAMVPRALDLPTMPDKLRTNSRALYGHFVNVSPWLDCLRMAGGNPDDHPFPCDQAAQHHVLDEGWMWQLRFDNGVTSVGVALDSSSETTESPRLSAEQEWDRLLRRYPTLRDQLAGARLVAPQGGLRATGRLQRFESQLAGPGWVLLPHTAGFVDPLHSTGIAHTLCGVERLVGLLAEHWQRPSLASALASYADTVKLELKFIDRLVHGCYQTLRRFELFTNFSMLYFAAATTYERRRLDELLPPGGAFLCADDEELTRIVEQVEQWLAAVTGGRTGMSASTFRERVAEAVTPYNHAGLCDPSCRNMYRYTAVPLDGQP
jgi:FADH2 O2-dependent halogenase